VAAGVLLAILVSALALLSLPRRRVRLNLAAASRLGRIQYGLLLGPSVLLAASLWLDIWLPASGHQNGQFFIFIILGGCIWGLVLAATALPSLGSRTTKAGLASAPLGWIWGDSFYRAGFRATPVILVAMFLVALAVAASLLSRHGLLDGRITILLFGGATLAIVLAFTVWFFSWPTALIPRSLRKTTHEPHRTQGE